MDECRGRPSIFTYPGHVFVTNIHDQHPSSTHRLPSLPYPFLMEVASISSRLSHMEVRLCWHQESHMSTWTYDLTCLFMIDLENVIALVQTSWHIFIHWMNMCLMILKEKHRVHKRFLGLHKLCEVWHTRFSKAYSTLTARRMGPWNIPVGCSESYARRLGLWLSSQYPTVNFPKAHIAG
jgi:hypothetical protein